MPVHLSEAVLDMFTDRTPRVASRISAAATLLAAVSWACATAVDPPPPAPPSARRVVAVSQDLQVTELRRGVWMHTSWNTLSNGTRFPSNGLLVADGEGPLLVDTAWGEPSTRALLAWIEGTLKKPLRRAVITHFHDDRLGGGALLAERGIPFLAHPLTRRLATEKSLPLPEALADVAEPGSAVPLGPVEVFHPGPAHTRDNLMVWVPSARLLFGGCAVRAAAAKDMGNVVDGDVRSWPEAIRRARARYAAALVVPGHGEVGGPELLQHTLDLLAK
jgi:metallo-beta-lactamase class B VIM